MPTLRTRYVNTASTAGGDGTTNATTGANRAYPSHEACRQAEVRGYDFVTNDVQLDVYCSGGADTTPADDITSGITDATRKVRWIAAAGHEAQEPFDTGRYHIAVDDYFAAIRQTEAYEEFIGLQIDNVRAASSDGRNSAVGINGAAGLKLFDRCGFRRSGAGSNPGNSTNQHVNVGGMADGDTVIVRNCFGHGQEYGVFQNGGTNTTVIFDNNTFVDAAQYNFYIVGYGTGVTWRFRNNRASGGGVNDFYRESTAATEDFQKNASADNTAIADTVGGGTLRNRTFTVVGSGDEHITASDAGAQDQGADLSADAYDAFSNDFDGNTRSGSWDVGANEVVTGSTISLESDGVSQVIGIGAPTLALNLQSGGVLQTVGLGNPSLVLALVVQGTLQVIGDGVLSLSIASQSNAVIQALGYATGIVFNLDLGSNPAASVVGSGILTLREELLSTGVVSLTGGGILSASLGTVSSQSVGEIQPIASGQVSLRSVLQSVGLIQPVGSGSVYLGESIFSNGEIGVVGKGILTLKRYVESVSRIALVGSAVPTIYIRVTSTGKIQVVGIAGIPDLPEFISTAGPHPLTVRFIDISNTIRWIN